VLLSSAGRHSSDLVGGAFLGRTRTAPSQSKVTAGGGRHRLGGSDVVIKQCAEVAMPGLRGDAVDRGAEDGCGRGVSGSERVARNPDAV
jgi:hypothetical protein